MSLKERINLVKQQFGISEADTLNIEKALGKKLVDYESIEALVATLMGYYNGELKKKANTSHTHDYAPSSHKHKKADISDFPTSMKNPYALSIQLNSGTAYTYDGAATKNINITPASIGAADSSHTHTKANITDFPTSMKNPNALEIKMNGQNPVSYDGAAAKSINITASGIGAEPAFKKNGAFNKNFGTTSNTVLEGAKLAEILGLTYGGSLNTSSAKTVNYAYYDSTTKKVYKCIKATSINYADANYFEAISNNDLLSKLQNLLIDTKLEDNGYIELGQLIIQWGRKQITTNTVTFPTPFPNKCFIVCTGQEYNTTLTDSYGHVYTGSITRTGFKTLTFHTAYYINWIAIGI